MGRYGDCDCICQGACVPTHSRPNSDFRIGPIFASKPGGELLYQQIDEINSDDGLTYIYAEQGVALGQYATFGMSTVTYLDTYFYDHLRWWQRAVGPGMVTIKTQVQYVYTTIVEFDYQSYVNDLWGQVDYVVPQDKAKLITGNEKLKLKFIIDSANSGDIAQVTQAEYERRCQDDCSDAATGNTKHCLSITVTGAAGTTEWACCSNLFDDTLTATLNGEDGLCSCADGKQISLKRIGSHYVGTSDLGCRKDAVQRLTLDLSCVAESVDDWKLEIRFDDECDVQSSYCAQDSSTCSPINLVFGNLCIPACCGILTSCIENVCGEDLSIPEVLNATFSDTTNNNWLNGIIVELQYDETTQTWTGEDSTIAGTVRFDAGFPQCPAGHPCGSGDTKVSIVMSCDENRHMRFQWTWELINDPNCSGFQPNGVFSDKPDSPGAAGIFTTSFSCEPFLWEIRRRDVVRNALEWSDDCSVPHEYTISISE